MYGLKYKEDLYLAKNKNRMESRQTEAAKAFLLANKIYDRLNNSFVLQKYSRQKVLKFENNIIIRMVITFSTSYVSLESRFWSLMYHLLPESQYIIRSNII